MDAPRYQPDGMIFYDRASRREMMLVTDGHWRGWLCYRHAEGQWVSLRKATRDDVEIIVAEFIESVWPSTDAALATAIG